MSILEKYPQLKTIQNLAKTKKIKVYLVGGFLRDYVLNKSKLDFDFAVSKNALSFARTFATTIKGAYVLLDQERGCARVVKKSGTDIYTFDFADFRAKTFEGDLKHRDFTINTLAVDISMITDKTPLEKVLIDRLKGLKDLKAKKIKLVSKAAFKDDPLRMMRAMSIKASLDFRVEKETISQIKKDLNLLRKVSYERIREELFKILESPRAAVVIKEMDQIGLLEKVIPQIHVMFDCPQGGYHHLDVWPHSLEVLSQLEKVIQDCQNDPDVKDYLNETLGGNHSRKAVLKLAALLHDIGKPETRKEEENGRLSFHGHEHVGKSIARSIARMLKLSRDERYALEDIVRWHLRPGYLADFKNPSERSVFRFFRDARAEAVSVLLLAIADQRSTRGPLSTKKDEEHHVGICRLLIKKWFDKKKEKPFVRLLNGHDIMKALKIKPSPLIGQILAKVEEHQSLGKIKNKAEALKLAKEMA